MVGRYAVGLGLVLLFTVGALAGPLKLDPEMKAQYVWRVLVQVKPHPTLGPTVRAQLLKDLKAALTSAVGDDLGTVEVSDLAIVSGLVATVAVLVRAAAAVTGRNDGPPSVAA